MRDEQTRAQQKVHIRNGIWAVVAFCFSYLMITAGVAVAKDPLPSGDERLITVYDQGQERTFLTNKTTIGDALATENIAVAEADIVEPKTSTKLVATNYQVNIYRARSVLVRDGVQNIQVLTAEQSPKRVMSAAGLTMYDEDIAKFELSQSPLTEGGAGIKLVVDRATPFMFNLYGKTFEARTKAVTVGGMLKEKGVVLGANDGQSASNETPIVAGMTVRIWRDGKSTMTVEETIPRVIEEIKDADRDYGNREVRAEGSDGKKNVTYEIEMKSGQEVSRKQIASVTTVEPVKQVIVVGTKFKGAYTTPGENENITWAFLIGKGLSREQTAGIMGNLMQEHGFNTTGDGLAQWTGGRKTALLSRPDPYNIHTQLDFLWYELSGPYSSVLAAIRAESTVEGSVRIFQDKFERCSICAESRRIQFAYNILASH